MASSVLLQLEQARANIESLLQDQPSTSEVEDAQNLLPPIDIETEADGTKQATDVSAMGELAKAYALTNNDKRQYTNYLSKREIA